MNTRHIELGFFFFLAAAAAIVSFFILKPYASALFVAVVFSVAFRPVHEFFSRRAVRAGTAAACTLLVLLLVVLIPATLFGFFVFDDARALYLSARSGESVFLRLDALSAPLEGYLRVFVPDARLNLSGYLQSGLSFLVGNFGSVFSGAVGLAFKTVIMLLALFYLFRDGPALRSFVMRLSPLANEYDNRILTRLEDAIASVVKGRLLIVFIQGVLSAIAFAAFGLSHPVLLGAVVSIAALIPFVGVGLIFVPAVLYLLFMGSAGNAVGLLVAGVVVGTVDNLLGPMLYERGLRLHPLLILLSVLGGLAFFGPVGFLAGPVTLALLFALLDLYPLLFEHKDVVS